MVRDRLKKEVKKAEEENRGCFCQLYDPLITSGDKIDIGMKALDEQYSSKIPIFILEANGHISHGNGKAFELAGVTKTTEDPKNGGKYVKDKDGELTGEIQ